MHLRCHLCAIVSVALLLSSGVFAGPVADDEWPRYGRDPNLTGRSPLHGRITAPHVAWTCSVAGRRLLLEVTPARAGTSLSIPASRPALPLTPRVPLPGPPLRDLDGTGKLRSAVETNHDRWAKILPDVSGLQRVAWNHTWTTEKVCRLQLFAYDKGFDQPRLVWKTDPPEDTIFSPLDIVYDIDGDGVQEVCVAAHYRVMIFEGTTGRKETELRYHTSRPYGWFGLADLDGDGQMELVTIGDFQSHIDVLRFDKSKPEGERLHVIWRRDIEDDISQRKKWPQIGPRPLADVNGDDRPEIVLNLYNDTGDDQWHVVVFEAMTGRVLHDFPSRFTRGHADVNGDGVSDLFLTESDGQFVPAAGKVELLSLKPGQPQVLWSRDDAGWVTADLPCMGPTWSTTASEGMRHVLLSEIDGVRPAFAVETVGKDSRSVTLLALRCDEQGQVQPLYEMSGLPAEVEGVAMARIGGGASMGMLLRAGLGAGVSASLEGRGAAVRVVEDEPLPAPISAPIAARLRPGGPMTVVVDCAGQEVCAIDPSSGDGPRILWRRHGRGMADGGKALGPVAADLDGDGGSEIIIADRSPRGHAVLVAYRHDGSVLWRREFPQIPGGPATWNVGAITFWWPGRFREPGRTDLFVDTRRSLMHSDVGNLVDGHSGKIIWSHDKAVLGNSQWGYAGSTLAAADINSDGRDEIVNLYPVAFWVADGRTGELIAAKDLASRKELPAWAAYGEPMVHDFNGDGRPEVLLDSVYILALLDTTGTPIWHGPGRADYPTAPGEGNVDETTSVRHALIDFDGDGRFEIASAGYGNGVRAIDPVNGKVLWSLNAPKPTCLRSSSADIDGKPGDELLCVAGDTLVAVTGDRKAGRLLWEWKGSAGLSLPAIADTDGDGQAEIIIQAADGTVCCLDSDATR